MAQLRQDYQQFVARNVEIVVVGPEDARAFSAYWQKQSLPFIGLPDPTASVLKLYNTIGRATAPWLVARWWNGRTIKCSTPMFQPYGRWKPTS